MSITLEAFGEIEYRFEKGPGGNMVNIYDTEGYEVDVFTDYGIGEDFVKFEESCQEWVDEVMGGYM